MRVRVRVSLLAVVAMTVVLAPLLRAIPLWTVTGEGGGVGVGVVSSWG